MATIKETLLSVCSRAICRGLDCKECHEIFNTDDCPTEYANDEERKELIKRLMENYMYDKIYPDMTEDDILDIVRGL